MALGLVLTIVLAALISEDGGVAAASVLAASSALNLPLALLGAVAGLWAGDLAIYGIARRYGRSALNSRWARRVTPEALARAEQWTSRRGGWALFLSRFLPGTRVAAYLTAGIGRMSVARFGLVTALSALLWSLVAIALGQQILQLLTPGSTILVIGLALSALLLAKSYRRAVKFLAKMSRWEFWPAGLFYAPVPFMCAWLGIKYRGLGLPTAANPAQRNGGIVGESKGEVLQELMRVAPSRTAASYLLGPASVSERVQTLRNLLDSGRLALPFVLKPDTAQRGEGFRKILSMEEACGYLAQVASPVVAQAYVPGPREAGIFYYRFPGKERGEIFAITEKEFPVITGDGVRTARELIEADPRARLIAGTYLRRLGPAADHVLPPGEKLRLVEAGNHCQGCIFRDGMDLHSEKLRAVLDEISQALPGFFIGRYDVRYATDDDLRAGRFTILELNGSASEATSIYDERNSLRSAYKTLYRQWELVYAIGAANRDRGQRPASVLDLWRDWRRYVRQSAFYPMAD